MKKMRLQRSVFVFGFLVCLFVCGSVVSDAADTTAEECNDVFQKMMICLDYAKGKSPTPSKDCCTSIKDIKDSKPKCLCYIIQQSHSGADALKSLGVQEDKLLQLPTACQIQNASISNCPSRFCLPKDLFITCFFIIMSDSFTAFVRTEIQL